jgi:hypothetical protein
MKMNIDARNIIDTAINAINDIDAYNRPGCCKGKTQEQIHYLERYNYAGNQVLYALADAIKCNCNDLYSAARIARRWYDRTHWEISLPEADAGALLEAAQTELLRMAEIDRVYWLSTYIPRQLARRA